MAEVEIGSVSDYFTRVGVAAIELTGTVKVGDVIKIKGHTTDMEMTVPSMEIDRREVSEAGAGQAVGIKVEDRVRRGDKVYKVV